jgi:PAS domain S-box-containing protein
MALWSIILLFPEYADQSHPITEDAVAPMPCDLLAADAIPQPIWMSTPNGAVTFCNRTWLAYTGQSREQALGAGWMTAVSPEERTAILARWREAMQAGLEFQMEYRLLRARDGAYRWHQVHVTPVRNETSALLFWLGVHMEIHERKQLEEEKQALIQSARCILWYADIMEATPPSPVPWWTIRHPDPDAAQQFLPLDLRPGEDYHVAHYRNRLEPYRTECDLRGAAAVRAGRGFSQEYPVRAADGSIRWLHEEVRVETVIPGQRWKAICLCVDVTERKAAQALAREHADRFRATFEQAAVGIALVGMEGEWLQVNQKLCDVLGYSREELHKTNYDDIRHPDDRAPGAISVQPLLVGIVDTYTVERRYFRRDGSVMWGNLTISLVRDHVNQPLHYICIIEDISERKRHESEIVARNADQQRRIHDFEDLLEERKRYEEELQTANRRLQRAMQETHHRVKNNLQLIAALLEMAREDHPEGLPQAESHRLLQQILLLSGVHDILTSAAKTTPGPTDNLSAKAVMGRMLALIKGAAPHIHFTYQLDDIVLSIHQATSLALIANELVSNAIKHGGGNVQLTLTRAGSEATLAVEDDGPGFGPKFDPQTAAGTGLSLVQNLAQHDLRGRHTFENRAEGGGRVSIIFPLLSPDACKK